MEKKVETVKKRYNFDNSNNKETRFSKDNQPPPEKKSAGWKKWREERHLTRGIIKELQDEKNFLEYIKSMIKLAKQGNPKAIDVVTKCIEEVEPIKLDIQSTKIFNIDPLDQ